MYLSETAKSYCTKFLFILLLLYFSYQLPLPHMIKRKGVFNATFSYYCITFVLQICALETTEIREK